MKPDTHRNLTLNPTSAHQLQLLEPFGMRDVRKKCAATSRCVLWTFSDVMVVITGVVASTVLVVIAIPVTTTTPVAVTVASIVTVIATVTASVTVWVVINPAHRVLNQPRQTSTNEANQHKMNLISHSEGVAHAA